MRVARFALVVEVGMGVRPCRGEQHQVGLARPQRSRRLAHQQHVLQLNARLAFAFAHRVHRCESHLARLNATLVSLDPAAVLERGYSITTSAGKVLRDASAVGAGERIETRLARGTLQSEVKKP